MKTGEDFKRAIGPADQSFSAAVQRSVHQLQQKEEKPMKKLSAALVVVAALLLILTVAVAAGMEWGVFDFFTERYGNRAQISPQAQDHLQTAVPQTGGQADSASFTLRQAVYDGHYLYMVVAAKPVQENVLLVDSFEVPEEDPVSDLLPDASADMTIAQYARNNGKTLLTTAIGGNCIDSQDYLWEEDGTLVYMTIGEAPAGPELDVTLSCYAFPFGNDSKEMERTDLCFTLTNTVQCTEALFGPPAMYSDCGAQVEEIALSLSPMATYYTISVTITDPEAYAKTDNGLWFEFLDENSERLPEGSTLSGSVEQVDDTHLIQKGSLGAMDSVPTQLILRGYNCWEKNRYEMHTFQKK